MQEENTESRELLEGFAWRLNSCADALGLSQVDIASALGVKPPRVGNWFQGRNLPRRSERVKLADLLKVSVEWLIQGTGEKNRSAVEEAPVGYVAVRQVPVISWTHAGAAANFEEMPKHFHGHVATSSRDRKAFGLIVEGDSMEPKFFAGDRVILEPSSAPVNNKPVVAKFIDDSIQLRNYTKLPGGKIRLAPYNQIYPTIEHSPKEFAWIWPVKELVRSV